MKVSKSSWHYRLQKWITPEDKLVNGELPPTNLCCYFWNVVILVGFGLPFFAMMMIIFSPMILLEYLGLLDQKPKDNTPKEPTTLIGKWIKSKKDGVCPNVEWTE